MKLGVHRWGAAAACWVLAGCVAPPPPDLVSPGPMVRQIVTERLAAVIVTSEDSIRSWHRRKFSIAQTPDDADGGSAAAIAPDGYFLTADHVLSKLDGKNVFVIFNRGGALDTKKARVVWRSDSADLALLHVAAKTPYFYRWSDPGQWLPEGTAVMHGGLATGAISPEGKLTRSLPPERFFTGNRRLKIDIPLQPGDSGGPIVDGYGALVGINSAVEFLVPLETAFFVDSEGNRPNTRMIENLIRRDRKRTMANRPVAF